MALMGVLLLIACVIWQNQRKEIEGGSGGFGKEGVLALFFIPVAEQTDGGSMSGELMYLVIPLVVILIVVLVMLKMDASKGKGLGVRLIDGKPRLLAMWPGPLAQMLFGNSEQTQDSDGGFTWPGPILKAIQQSQSDSGGAEKNLPFNVVFWNSIHSIRDQNLANFRKNITQSNFNIRENGTLMSVMKLRVFPLIPTDASESASPPPAAGAIPPPPMPIAPIAQGQMGVPPAVPGLGHDQVSGQEEEIPIRGE